MHTRQKKTFFTKGCDHFLTCNYLVACIAWPSIRQSLCVSPSSVTACWLPKGSASALISASPSYVEVSESWSKHDWMHRVGSQRRLELATACSDSPTDAQCNCSAHTLSCTNFVAIVGAGQLWWAWFIAHSWLLTFKFRSERGNQYF